MKNLITKEEYLELKEKIMNDSSINVKTTQKTNRKKLQHTTTISSEWGKLVLFISGDQTTYSFG